LCKAGLDKEELDKDEQAKEFYNDMRAHTRDLKYELPRFRQKDSMVKLLSSIIFTVTAWHELVGQIVDYTELPSRCGVRLTKRDPSKIDLQSYL